MMAVRLNARFVPTLPRLLTAIAEAIALSAKGSDVAQGVHLIVAGDQPTRHDASSDLEPSAPRSASNVIARTYQVDRHGLPDAARMAETNRPYGLGKCLGRAARQRARANEHPRADLDPGAGRSASAI
jgi:hypothetical protein